MSFDIHRAMPDGCRVFFRGRALRDIQQQAAQPLLNGVSLVLSAPTASGKTEAVFAPLYQRHVAFARPSLSVVYIAPTKALVNDMFERLTTYFGEAIPDIVQRYTGDHHDYNDGRGRFVLLCTPEALDSLQLVKPELLCAVRAVICDELHLLHGTARGQQLRSVIARMRAKADTPRNPKDVFQIVGTTATLQNAQEVAALWCGPDGRVIAVGDPRDLDFSLVVPDVRGLAPTLAERIEAADCRKALVFCNSRNGAHELAAALSDALKGTNWPVHLHIGILAKAERERVESAMKRERLGICVATSTLEVGIDVGDIDVVVLADPPSSVSAFLQRIGRGNRRSDKCVVWGCAPDDWAGTLFPALKRCAQLGQLDDVHEYSRPSVDFQQIISAAWIGLRQHRALTRATLDNRTGGSVEHAVLDDMLETGALKEAGSALLPSDEWCDIGDERRIHSVIVGTPGLPLVDVHSGEVIGNGAAIGAGGVLFAGGGFRSIQGADEQGVYVGAVGAKRSAALVRLPSTRGRIRGLSRQIVGAIAEIQGSDPLQWHRDRESLITWGGYPYNFLLKGILVASGHPKKITVDAFGLNDLEPAFGVTPEDVLVKAADVFDNNRLPRAIVERFREGTQFLRNLSPALQLQEARRAVPREGFLTWVRSCRL